MSYEWNTPTSEDFIAHYGVKHRSGRYPWGSGKKNQPSVRIKRKDLKRYISDYNKMNPKSKIKLNKNSVIQVGKYKYDSKGRRLREDVSDANNPPRQNASSSSGTQTSERKTVSQMTMDELMAATNRMRAEKAYNDAYKDLNPSPQVSRGAQFIKSLGSSILKNGVENFVGKTVSGLTDKIAEKSVAAATKKLFGVKNTDLSKTPEELERMEDDVVQDIKNKYANIAAIRVTQEAMKNLGEFTDKDGKAHPYQQAQAAFSPYKKQK